MICRWKKLKVGKLTGEIFFVAVEIPGIDSLQADQGSNNSGKKKMQA